MSIDTRHYAWCSLGHLAAPPAGATTLADDYVQRKGVVTTRGTVILQGMHRPAAGTPVALAYGNGMWVARVPRRLRVLSSFADPQRGITTVSVGCLFAYHENRRPPVKNPTEREQNPTLGSIVSISSGQSVSHNQSTYNAVRRIAALPMRASLVIQNIFTALGLTSATSIPFEIYRVTDEWDLSAGYVEELDRIVSSAGYFCRINDNEMVEFIDKGQNLAQGPLITQSQIIDLNPINVGELPGDAVYARFSQARLATPVASISVNNNGEEQQEPLSDDEQKKRNWEKERTDGGTAQIIHSYTIPGNATIKEYAVFNEYSFSETGYDDADRVTYRREVKNGPTGESITITRTFYDPGSASPREQSTETFSPVAEIATSCGFEGPLAQLRALGSYRSRDVVITYERDDSTGNTLTKTVQRIPYINTPFGSDAISRLREERRPSEPIQELINEASRLISYGGSVQIRTERNFGAQTRPGQQARNKKALQKQSDNTNTNEQEIRLAWAVGSSASQTAIELSPPYVSDDFTAVSIATTGPRYANYRSNASQQALNYARIENRLLLGNRNGAALQLAPTDMPAQPFSLFYIRVNGTTAAYRTNGTTWTINANGNIVCSTDAMFWGAIDGNIEAAFFPLPPGTTALPSQASVTVNPNPMPANAIAPPAGFNPAAPDLVGLFAALPTTQPAVPRATLNPAQIITPWLETIRVAAGVRIGAVSSVQFWLPITISAAAGVRTGAVASVANLTIDVAIAGAVTYPLTLEQGAFGGDLAIGTAEVTAAMSPVEISQVSGSITGDVEMQIIPAVIDARTTDVSVTNGFGANIETILSSAIVSADTISVDLVASDPPFWVETQLLLPMSGADNSTVFTDLSKYNRTVQVFGDTKIRTDLGEPAGFFDGNGDYLDVNIPVIGTGDFTIEMFIRPSNLTYDSERCLAFFGDFSSFSFNGILAQGGTKVSFQGTQNIRFGPASGIGPGGLVANTWHHVALCRAGTTARIFLDGALSVDGVNTVETSNWNSGRIRIGGESARYFYSGHMKWFRLTTAARYTAPFTPPTALAPNS